MLPLGISSAAGSVVGEIVGLHQRALLLGGVLLVGGVNGALLHGRTIPAGAFLLLGGGEQPGLDRRSALILGLGLGLGGRLLLFLPLLLGLASLGLLRLGLLLFGRVSFFRKRILIYLCEEFEKIVRL